MVTTQLQQVHLVKQAPGYQLVDPSTSNLLPGIDGIATAADLYRQEHEALEDNLLAACAAHLWHKGSYRAVCPRPILIRKHHQRQLEALHEALTAAIIDIVQRWWTDEEARLPERMPLEPEEEEHLKWMDAQVANGTLQEFTACLGSWRPDFLVEEYRDSDRRGRVLSENFSITEINARFSFNGFMHEAYGQRALDDVLAGIGAGAEGLVSATNADKILDGLFSLFRPDRPLHLLKDQENGIDIHMFIDAVERRFGIKPRIIDPAQLRLLPNGNDDGGQGGFRLCCLVSPTPTVSGGGDDRDRDQGMGRDTNEVPPHTTTPALITTPDGELVEEIFQVGLELHQRELAALAPEMLRQISLRCFNDMRTIFLVHDKRMLGIVKQELPRLVARGVLTRTQAATLRRGVVDTALPGSSELQRILDASRADPSVRDGYLMKPIRGGKGAGIVFGDDMTADDWIALLERLSRSASIEAGVSSVVQRRIEPRLYDVVLKASGERHSYPLVGTYHVVNGRLLGLGTWRASGGRIVAKEEDKSYPGYSLSEILADADAHPFYAAEAEYPPDPRTLRDIQTQVIEKSDVAAGADSGHLQARPLLWKTNLYTAIQRLIADTSPSNTFRRGVYSSVTGGGSGPNPLFFATDVHENRRHRAQFGAFIRRMGLLSDADWVVTLHMGGGLYRSLDLTLELLENAGASVLAAGSYMKPAEVVRLLGQYHANVISGESSQVVQLTHYISTLSVQDRALITIDKIIYTSEGLTPSQRAYLHSVLGPVQIFSILGSAEAGPYAVSCLHLLDSVAAADQQSFVFDTRHTIIEILPLLPQDDCQDTDGSIKPVPLEHGHIGMIAQTSLSRLRNPLVRYITGDVGSLHRLPATARNRVCAGDWDHLCVLRLQGRDRRFSFAWDGDYFEFQGLERILNDEVQGVLQWQVILEKREASQEVVLEIRLLRSESSSASADGIVSRSDCGLEGRIRDFLLVSALNEDRFR
ncbi:uncharacterized protein J7T54_003818, partial [Emericellopsis cladophorae]